MIGIIPGNSKTFIVEGMLNDIELEEGKLYADPKTDRIYYYSLIEKRSNPSTGYFPIWDGSDRHISKFSNEKYLDKDVSITDIPVMCSNINSDVAERVLYQQRKSENDEVLEPQISDGDNMFTQCIKGVLNVKRYTLVDLIDISRPRLDRKVIMNYYSALTKITFMRLDKWNIWMDVILHMKYSVIIHKDDTIIISYQYPSDIFDTGDVTYDEIINIKDDPFKKIIKILMIIENVTKTSLKSKEVDDYTINNMLTTLNSKKSLSAQLFSRFIRMTGLSYTINIFEEDDLIFQYLE